MMCLCVCLCLCEWVLCVHVVPAIPLSSKMEQKVTAFFPPLSKNLFNLSVLQPSCSPPYILSSNSLPLLPSAAPPICVFSIISQKGASLSWASTKLGISRCHKTKSLLLYSGWQGTTAWGLGSQKLVKETGIDLASTPCRPTYRPSYITITYM